MSDHPDIMIVDQDDRPIGAMQKDRAIAEGHYHRISRVLVFNQAGELYMQLRGPAVAYPNLWDQSVGGHVDAGEDYREAAQREALEEIGLTDLDLEEVGGFYEDLESGDTVLKRFNRIFKATTVRQPVANPAEVAEGKWITLPTLKQEMADHPERFTDGFRRTMQIYEESDG